MPVVFPEYQGDGDPRPALVALLRAVHDLLDELVWKPFDENGEPLFREEFVNDLMGAWKETEGSFGTAIDGISNVTESELEAHGLVGIALRLKLRVVRWWHERYKGKGKIVLGKLFSAIDGCVLDSILDVLKASKPISEFKETARAALLLD